MSLVRLDPNSDVTESRNKLKRGLNGRIVHSSDCLSLSNTRWRTMSIIQIFAFTTSLESLLFHERTILPFTALPDVKAELHDMVNPLGVVSSLYEKGYIKSG